MSEKMPDRMWTDISKKQMECWKECRVECLKICQIVCQVEFQIECQNMSGKMSLKMWNGMSEDCQTECQKIAQMECHNGCLTEWSECQKICQIKISLGDDSYFGILHRMKPLNVASSQVSGRDWLEIPLQMGPAEFHIRKHTSKHISTSCSTGD